MLKLLRRFRYHILVFLAVLGPGFITANVDNDSGGIFTYSAAGARFGYMPLWTLLPITLALIVTQEMCSRMGAVTGKGLSDLIREEFGLRVTFVIMALLVLANMTNVMAEFAGVASSLELFGVSRYITGPAFGRRGVVPGGERQLQERREDLSVRLPAVRDLHHFRVPGESGLESRGHQQRQADADARPATTSTC